MAYGSGKRLGETIDPRLMMADFSGFERAGQIMGQGFANAGKQIGDTIKENTQKQNDISAGIKMATAIKQAVPELSPIADEVLGQLSNPDLSTNQKIQSLAGIKEAMQISLLGKQETRADAALAIQKAELAAKIAGAGNNPPQGTFMTREEFSSLTNSGIPVKGIPTQDGRIYVTDISGNQPGILGSNVAMVNGQPTRVPTPQINLPAWGAGANIQNALPQGQGGKFPDNVPTTGLPIGEANVFTPGVSVDGTPGVLPPKEESKTLDNIDPNNITPEQVSLFGAIKKGELIPRLDPKGNVTAYAIPGTPEEQTQKLNEIKIQQEQTALEVEKRKTESEQEKKLRLQDYSTGMADNVLLNINKALNSVREMPQTKGSAGGIIRTGMGFVPNSTVDQVNQAIGTTENIIAADKIQQMRNASPTGGSLGNTSDRDIQLLKESIVSLKSTQDPSKLEEALYIVQMKYLDAIHGNEEERKKKLKSGEIDKESYDFVEGLYPPIKINAKGEVVPREEKKKIDILQKFELDPRLK